MSVEINVDKHGREVIDRFLAKIRKTESCHIWTGATRGELGVGQFQITQGKIESARRFAYKLWVGPIPSGSNLQVKSTCSSELCVHPEHLVPTHGKTEIVLNENDVARFWSKVDRSGGPEACWPYQGGTFGPSPTNPKLVYGLFVACGTNFKSHRVAFAIANGIAAPNTIQVRHKTCNNTLCCNPAHLEPGTAQQNMDDKVKAGRQARLQGEANGNATLTEKSVPLIRQLRADGKTLEQLAKEFGASIPAIGNACTGKTWTHVGGPITKKFTRHN